jgi:tRNA(adenine34) deaminase
VTTVSTAPPPGLFMKDARTIAKVLASKRVSPKGMTSGLRMLLFYINRAGRWLSASRRAELLRAKRLMQAMVAERRERKGR